MLAAWILWIGKLLEHSEAGGTVLTRTWRLYGHMGC